MKDFKEFLVEGSSKEVNPLIGFREFARKKGFKGLELVKYYPGKQKSAFRFRKDVERKGEVSKDLGAYFNHKNGHFAVEMPYDIDEYTLGDIEQLVGDFAHSKGFKTKFVKDGDYNYYFIGKEFKNNSVKEELEYEEIEVEPVFLMSENEELTEENTAVVFEDEELTEELLEALKNNEKYADFSGHQVIVDKNSGVIQYGQFKGKRVNLVKDRQRNAKKMYKKVDREIGIDQKANDNLNKWWEKNDRYYYNALRKRDDKEAKELTADLAKRIKERPEKRKEVANRVGKLTKYFLKTRRQQPAKYEREYRARYKQYDVDRYRREGIPTRGEPLPKKVEDVLKK